MFGLGGVDVVKGNFKRTWKFGPVNDDQVCPGSSVGYFCLQVVKNSPVVMRIQVFMESRSRLEVAVLLLVVRHVQNLEFSCVKLIVTRSTAIALVSLGTIKRSLVPHPETVASREGLSDIPEPYKALQGLDMKSSCMFVLFLVAEAVYPTFPPFRVHPSTTLGRVPASGSPLSSPSFVFTTT